MNLLPFNWPAFLIGLIIAAYWARVLRLVIKTRRRTGRAANFLPPEPLGRVLRIIWYPVVGIWIGHLFFSAYRHHPPVLATPLYLLPAVSWLAVAVAALAFLATLICWKKMGKSWRMGIDPNEKTQLVVSGPYAYVRHPIYALSSLLMLATMLALPSPLMLLAGAAHLLFLQWEAAREEKYLIGIHGSAYADYRASVGRFMPRLLARHTAG